MNLIFAFVIGMWDWRTGATAKFASPPYTIEEWHLRCAYENGQDFVHRLTFRQFETWA